MQYNIMGLNQERCIEIGLNVDSILIFKWFHKFMLTEKMVKRVVNDKTWYWVKYEAVGEDIPILKNSPYTIARKFGILVESGLLEHLHFKSKGSFAMYRVNKEVYTYLIDSEHMKGEDGAHVENDRGGSVENDRGGSVENDRPKDYSTIINPTTNKDKKMFNKTSTDNSAHAEITDNLFNVDSSEKKENEFISFWNDIKEATSHKKRTTKTYSNLSENISKILEGTFDKEMDKNWLKDNKLKNVFKKPMTKKELYHVIGDYDKQFKPEYQPEDKSLLNKNFTDFIYNIMSKKSQLVYLANYPPKKIGVISPDTVRKRLPEEISKIVDDLLRIRTPNISDPHRLQVYVHVESALKLYKELRPLSTSPYIKNKLTFFKAWVAYINTYNEVNTSTFTTTGYVWDKFIQRMEENHNVNLNPKQKVVEVKATMTVIDKELEIDEEVDLTSQLYP